MPLTTVSPGMLDTTAQYYSFKNRIFNGSFAIDQRSAYGSVTVQNSNNTYLVDRWWGFSFGANCTGQIVTISGLKRFRFTGAASVTQVNLGTRLEAANTADMAGTSVTLSLKASSTSLTSLTWTLFYANATDNFGTLNLASQTQIATGSWTINSTENTYTATISVPSAATTGLAIQLTGGALLAAQTLTLGDIQLEKGTTATSFDYRPYGTELALCQRYFQKSWAVETAVGTATSIGVVIAGGSNVGATTGLISGGSINFKVNLRGTPIVVIYDTAGNVNKVQRWQLGVTNSNNANVTVELASSTSCLFYSDSGVSSSGLQAHYTASAEL
jgi:hypothetical protein